jgi:hypothetical protein
MFNTGPCEYQGRLGSSRQLIANPNMSSTICGFTLSNFHANPKGTIAYLQEAMHDPPSAAFFDHLFTPDCYALHLATNHSDISSIHQLLDAGHNINTAHAPRGNSDGYGTALHIAIWRN